MIANLIVITLFFYLHLCRYIKTTSYQWIVEIFIQAIQLSDNYIMIPVNTPDDILNTWDITLLLDIQNNCVWGEYFTMETTGLEHINHVRAATRHFLYLSHFHTPRSTLICTNYFNPELTSCSVTSLRIITALCLYAGELGHAKLIFYLREIDFHSLHLVVAMSLHFAGIVDSTIETFSSWRSDDFFFYLQGHIPTVPCGVSRSISKL